MTDTFTAAIEFTSAGYSVIPAKQDGSKAPLAGKSWKRWQSERADEEQLRTWFASGHPGIGVVTGEISGNLEMLELEGRAVDEGLLGKLSQLAADTGLDQLLMRIMTGYMERSPSGGIHMFYRLPTPPPGNTKLASREATPEELTGQERAEFDKTNRLPPRVLIETRGEGGFVVTAPSSGRTHPTGLPWCVLSGTPANVAQVDAQERENLLALCRTLNTYRDHVLDTVPTYTAPAPTGELSPGDDYNLRGSWQELMEAAGWRVHSTQGSATTWTRPGKDHGPSAISGGDKGDLLYVFSTSTGLPTETGLSKWRVYALLNHNGDFPSAARELRRQGYGSPMPEAYRGSAQDQTDRGMFKPSRLTPPAGTSANDQQVTTDFGAGSVVDAGDDEWFWSQREELDHVRRFARMRKAAPYAVLGHVLARVIATMPHGVVLPPTIGGIGSLNIFVAVVAESGLGKSAARAAGQDSVLIIDEAKEFPIGSGEGIAATYVKPPVKVKASPNDVTISTGVQWIRHNALFHIGEVGTLSGLAARGGSTLLYELNKMYVGDQLGFANRAQDTRLPVDKHEYRGCITVDVQPGMANVLLDNEDAGFPQRFMFVTTRDPGRIRGRYKGPDIGPITWRIPDDLHTGKMSMPRITMEVDESIQDEIVANDDAAHDGDQSAIRGHHYFTQLKLAAGLAIFNGRSAITVDDWKLAEHLMSHSNAILKGLKYEASRRFEQSNIARGEAEAVRDVVKTDYVQTEALKRVSKRVLAIINDNPDGISHSALRKRLSPAHRPSLDEVAQALIAANLILANSGENHNAIEGTVYRPT